MNLNLKVQAFFTFAEACTCLGSLGKEIILCVDMTYPRRKPDGTNTMTLPHIGIISLTLKYFCSSLKHSSFWASAVAQPMSNDLEHAIPCLLSLSLSLPLAFVSLEQML
jgi:hypothetical protein